jgi:hypothetical protein
MSLPVSDLIWHIQQWIELQELIHPKKDAHAGLDCDFEKFEG